MRVRYMLLLLLLSASSLSAQLTITPGAELFVVGDMELTLHNTDLINNGIFSPGVNRTSFTGDVSSFISGSGTVRLFQLEVNKTANKSVVLQKPINVVNRILLTSGFFDLNGFNADLENTGQIDGEREDSRVIGSNGGQLVLRTVLNAPSNVNPGNLGAVISSTKDLGAVIITRGHQSQNGSGISGSILRYYEIIPTNNSNLNAELKFNYFDGELNNYDENSLVVFKSEDGINWADQDFTSRNLLNNFVTKSGINSFSRWTLSNSSAPLPIFFILFNARCEGDKVSLTWKTAQEQNSSRFDIERSVDGSQWAVIGSLPAAGTSSSEKTYLFTDNNPIQNNFYRIAEYDLGGRVQYTSVIRSSCNVTNIFTVWPNPVHDVVFINIASGTRSQVITKVFDSKGSLVKVQQSEILPGNNQLRVNIGSLANGIYSLRMDWNNGQMPKTVRVVKQ